MRSALGAGRGRIIGQLSPRAPSCPRAEGPRDAPRRVAIRGFVAFAPAGTPRLDEIQLNGTAIGGRHRYHGRCDPAVRPRSRARHVARRAEDALRSGSRQTGAGRGFRLGTEALVVGQIALALLMLSAAGLITRSLMKLERVDLAFDPTRLLVAELALPYEGFGDTRKQIALLDRLLPRLEAVPGVRAVTPVLTPRS